MLRSAGIIVPGDPSASVPAVSLTPDDDHHHPTGARPPLPRSSIDLAAPTMRPHPMASHATPIATTWDVDFITAGPQAAQSSPSQASSSFVLASMPLPPTRRHDQPIFQAPPLASIASAADPDPIPISCHVQPTASATPLAFDTIESSPTLNTSSSSSSSHGTDPPPSILANANLDDGPRISVAFRDLVYTVPVRTVDNGHGHGHGTGHGVGGGGTAHGLAADPEAPASPNKATSKWWHFGKWRAGNGRAEKVVLHGISGEFLPGQLVGILGPSGSGKTSLLNIMAGLPSTGAVTGKVMLNNQPLAPAEIRSVVGFVFQDDLILETMTVTEALAMSLRLRNPPMSQEEERNRIDLAIDLLGLQDARDTLIGSAMQKGISGGERKRVAIGMELMARPAVVLLDECTTGLDSYTAYSVCSLLHKLAHRQGKTIVCTLHQPTWGSNPMHSVCSWASMHVISIMAPDPLQEMHVNT